LGVGVSYKKGHVEWLKPSNQTEDWVIMEIYNKIHRSHISELKLVGSSYRFSKEMEFLKKTIRKAAVGIYIPNIGVCHSIWYISKNYFSKI